MEMSIYDFKFIYFNKLILKEWIYSFFFIFISFDNVWIRGVVRLMGMGVSVFIVLLICYFLCM